MLRFLAGNSKDSKQLRGSRDTSPFLDPDDSQFGIEPNLSLPSDLPHKPSAPPPPAEVIGTAKVLRERNLKELKKQLKATKGASSPSEPSSPETPSASSGPQEHPSLKDARL